VFGYHHHDGDPNRVTFNDANTIGAEENVVGNAVAVDGSLTVDGTVDGNGVAVLGNTTINGTVHGNAVAVLGTLRLGPNARVDGNAVSVGGRVVKDRTAFVGGNIVPINFGADLADRPSAHSFWRNGILLGRPLAIGPHLLFFWIANLCVAALYCLLAVIFPNGVRKCADTLEFRPGLTLLTGLLSILGVPLLFILLLITVVGIPVAIVVLPIAAICCLLFGKVGVYSLIGRSIIGKRHSAALAVLVGVVVFLILYLIPALGLMLWFLMAFLGFSCALTALFLSRTPPAAVPAAVVPAPLVPPMAAAPFAVGAVAVAPLMPVAPAVSADLAAPEVPRAPDPAGVPPLVEPPPVGTAPLPVAPVLPLVSPAIPGVADASLPRAGFWLRMVSIAVDAILIGIVVHSSDYFFPSLAVYAALLWKLRGATVGGIIFGLKVVRLDGRPMDWPTAVVRSVACFLSLFAAGLGFIWIAFDAEKQGWHDKIAGTVVVKLSRGASLV
jgi:uncharacterized RDD family membrane protein YckC/cytoskeletal protein CcmA (bactofilin family)